MERATDVTFSCSLLGPLLCLIVGMSSNAHAQSVLQSPTGAFIAGGSVLASVVQGDGKVLIGGQFNAVSGILRQNIARLNADGSVDLSFDPGVTGTVNALAISGNTIYVGGYYQEVGGHPRNSIAALDVATGSVAPWDPGTPSNTFSQIYAISVSGDGSTVYVGGQFNEIGGAPRQNIAALSGADAGALPTWNPGATNDVYALLVLDNVLYVGGSFNQIGGQTRSSIAALDVTSGAVSAWNPVVAGYVLALAGMGNTVYAGGQFNSIGNVTRRGLAALDVTSGLATAWNPDPNFAVTALTIAGNTVYLGGGQAAANLEAVDATTGIAAAWSPNPDNTVNSIAVSGSSVYAGGQFMNVGGNLTGGFARIDAMTGSTNAEQLSGSSGTIATIKAQPDGKVVVAGNFTAIGSVPRNYITRLNGDGSVDQSWNPGADADGSVTAVGIYNNLVYVGGNFQNIGGHFRRGLAAIDATTGLSTAWQPDPDGQVNTIVASANAVYVGGNFGNVGNAMRSRLAALTVDTGLALNWDPNPDGTIYNLALEGNQLYLGGNFQHVAGQPRSNLAAVDASSAQLQLWNPSSDSQVKALTLSGNTLYVGGSYYQVGGAIRNGIAAFDTSTGLISNWSPSSFGGDVESIDVSGNDVLVAGEFSYMGVDGPSRLNVAIVDSITGNALDWNPGAQYVLNPGYQVWVFGAAFANGVVYIGGLFDTVGTKLRGSLAAVASPDLIFKNGFE